MAAQAPDQIHDLFAQAFNAGDLDALMALYEPTAVLVTGPGQVASGSDQIREALGGFLALNGPVQMTPVATIEGDGIAVLHARWTIDGTGPDGQPVTVNGVTADIVRRGADGTWRFALDNPAVDATIGAS